MIETLIAFIEKLSLSVRIRLAGLGAATILRLRGIVVGRRCGFLGMPLVSRHPSSRITIGDRVRIVSKAYGTALGVSHPCVLRTLTSEAIIQIGDRTGISGGSICAAREVFIGADCLIGADVVITDTDFHPLDPHHRSDSTAAFRQARPVVIRDNVFLGTRVTVLKGVEIGRNTVIGAGSVVTRNVPANVVAAGNPCCVIRDLGDRTAFCE